MKANHLKFYREPVLNAPTLLATWREDAGGLGPGVADFLINKLGAERFCSIQPLGYFPVGEVDIKDDLIQFCQSDFYASERGNLIIFTSDAPRYEWYSFLSLVLDIAEKYRAKRLYSMGGMVTLGAHTAPRRVMTITNNQGLREELVGLGFFSDMDFRTPPGGRPTLSSFLLWIARQRGTAGANVWVETPFYLTAVNDFGGRKLSIELLNDRLGLNLDMKELQEAAARQEERLREIRLEKPVVDSYIGKLERGEALEQQEGETLVKEIQELLGQG